MSAGRTSQKHALRLAQLKAGDVTEPAPEWVNAGAVRAVIGAIADRLTPCSGGCGLELLPYGDYQRLPVPKRKRIRELGVNRQSSFGRCWKCANEGKEKSAHGSAAVRRRISKEKMDAFPDAWIKICENGGSYKQAAEVLGCTGEHVRQLVRDLGLPKPAGRANRVLVDYFLEELHHLVSFGLGVHEIAQKLGTTADDLVRRIDRLRARGLTAVSFPTYFRYYDKEDAA